MAVPDSEQPLLRGGTAGGKALLYPLPNGTDVGAGKLLSEIRIVRLKCIDDHAVLAQ